jgi:hypothetical protein
MARYRGADVAAAKVYRKVYRMVYRMLAQPGVTHCTASLGMAGSTRSPLNVTPRLERVGVFRLTPMRPFGRSSLVVVGAAAEIPMNAVFAQHVHRHVQHSGLGMAGSSRPNRGATPRPVRSGQYFVE